MGGHAATAGPVENVIVNITATRLNNLLVLVMIRSSLCFVEPLLMITHAQFQVSFTINTSHQCRKMQKGYIVAWVHCSWSRCIMVVKPLIWSRRS